MKSLYIIGACVSITLFAACTGNSPLAPTAPQHTGSLSSARPTPKAGRSQTSQETVLWNFGIPPNKQCSDEVANGDYPLGGLLANRKGVLYGTTSGEVEDCGNAGQVYEMVPVSSGGYAKQALYYFCGLGPSCSPYNDGEHPQGELIADTSGALYGTTSGGGSNGDGTVFKLTRNKKRWTETLIHQFNRFQDGARPSEGLVMDTSGALYGTTSQKGQSNGAGAIFRLTPAGSGWTETILHIFGGYPNDGGQPLGRLLYINKNGGILYGTTSSGGSSICNYFPCGTVFEFDLSTNAYHIIYNFSGPDGAMPTAGLIADKKGNLYGTTPSGGTSCSYPGTPPQCGTVFKLSPSRRAYKETVLFSFDFFDGAKPQAPLLADSAGDLYGTTQYGGIVCEYGGFSCGTVFKLTRSGKTYTESVVYSFGATTSLDGWFPTAPVIAVKGDLFGTTPSGGVNGVPCCDGGTVFEITP